MNEFRTMRNRHTALADGFDRRGGGGPTNATARFIGQVTTGGTLPDCVPCVYLLNPITLGGPEVEGGTESPAVETATLVPVVVLGPRPPKLGAYLEAFAIGGRWVTGYTCLQVVQVLCNGTPVSGATVAISGGPSAVTDSSGIAAFTLGPGTYTATVTGGSPTCDSSGPYSVTFDGCGSLQTIQCCSGTGHPCGEDCTVGGAMTLDWTAGPHNPCGGSGTATLNWIGGTEWDSGCVSICDGVYGTFSYTCGGLLVIEWNEDAECSSESGIFFCEFVPESVSCPPFMATFNTDPGGSLCADGAMFSSLTLTGS